MTPGIEQTRTVDGAVAHDRVPAGDGDVRHLLRPGALQMLAQPIVALGEGNVVAYELLARPTATTEHTPEQWLGLAGRSGVRTEVELACLEAASRRGTPPDGRRVFVNLSPSTVLDTRTDAFLDRLPPHVIEITEHEPVTDYEALRTRLQQWSSARTLLAVDDVGTGFASMAHVLHLRPQFIKIDRGLVRGVHRDRNQLAVLKGIVGYARQCGATSLAEGVESNEELNALRAVGVDLVQGFLLARPGTGWPRPRAIRARTGAAKSPGPSPTVVGSLAERVDLLIDPREAADEVTSHLYEHLGVLPSVYVERAGVLRYLSGRGQWQLFDGIEYGVGLTGTAYREERPVLVQNVASDPRYRQAAPGVVAELALPLWVDNRIAGILNVDAPSAIEDEQMEAVASAARLLEQAFDRIGLPSSGESSLLTLGRHAPRIASSESLRDVATAGMAAAIPIAGLDCGGLWFEQGGRLRLAAADGTGSGVLHALGLTQTTELSHLVAQVASSRSTGPIFTKAFGPMGALRDQGFGTVFVAAVKDRDRATGLLVLAGRDASVIPADVVEAIELLCVLIGVTEGRIQHRAAG